MKTEPQCLIINPGMNSSVSYHQVAARLITPEVREEIKKAKRVDVLFSPGEMDGYRYPSLPACLIPLEGEIKPLDKVSGEQWNGAFAEGPWVSFLAVYNWR